MSISEQKMGIPIRNTQNNLKTSQYFRNHPDNRCRSQPSPNRAGALLGLWLTPVIFSCTCPGSCHHEQPREQKNHLYQTHRHPLLFFFALHTKFLCSGKSPEKLRFSGLAGAFTWNISVRRMQACASVFAPCSLLPSRTLYHNSGSLFVLLDNMIELAERNCHYKSDKQ